MKLINRMFVLGVICSFGSACTTIKTNELSNEESVSLKDKTLIYSKYQELPDFAAQTAVNVQFGLIGAATAISNGNKLIQNNEIAPIAVT